MNRRVAGAIGLAVGLGGAAMTLGDFRRRQSRFWLSGGVNMFTFDRDRDPMMFWGSTIANWLLIGLITAGGALAVLLPGA
ncbi:MAG: hypothetical protein B7Y45_12875 [Sphingomonas sp. 28-66-16]|nr:MAG: hypothetical protein B7Y45_12875 [Sphingomonas sp. 28-66-16]